MPATNMLNWSGMVLIPNGQKLKKIIKGRLRCRGNAALKFHLLIGISKHIIADWSYWLRTSSQWCLEVWWSTSTAFMLIVTSCIDRQRKSFRMNKRCVHKIITGLPFDPHPETKHCNYNDQSIRNFSDEHRCQSHCNSSPGRLWKKRLAMVESSKSRTTW